MGYNPRKQPTPRQSLEDHGIQKDRGQQDAMTPQEQFWCWFIEHEDELMDFERDQEAIFDRLSDQLIAVDRDLCFEFGPKRATREFVVSAGGIKRAFPAVTSLVAAAPKLVRWQVTAFRPRRWPLNAVQFGGVTVRPESVQFKLLDNGKLAGIVLFIPGFREEDVNLKMIGFLILDDALGEYDVETRLGLINMMAPEASESGKRHPLTDLPSLFDRLIEQLEGRPRKPS